MGLLVPLINPRSVELMLVGYLATLVSAPITVDAEQDFTPPLLVVERVGGAHDGFRLDRPVIDIDVFAKTREHAESLAWQADSALLALTGAQQRELVVTDVSVRSAPRHISYGNRGLRRFASTYELVIHAA